MVDCLLIILVNQISRLFSIPQTPDPIITQEYNHPIYNHPNIYPHMSILDLLFYELPNALEIIRSGRKWILMNEEMA